MKWIEQWYLGGQKTETPTIILSIGGRRASDVRHVILRTNVTTEFTGISYYPAVCLRRIGGWHPERRRVGFKSMGLTQHRIAFGWDRGNQAEDNTTRPAPSSQSWTPGVFLLENKQRPDRSRGADLSGLVLCLSALLASEAPLRLSDFVTGPHRLRRDDELVGVNVLVAVAGVKA